MLYEKMKKDRILAMKEKNKFKKDTLTTFIGDIDSEGKRGTEITDALVISRIKKAIQNAKDNHDISHDKKFLEEINVYEAYLPKQMSEKEIENAVKEIIESQERPNIGSVMKEIKSRYDGQYDGKLASTIIKNLL